MKEEADYIHLEPGLPLEHSIKRLRGREDGVKSVGEYRPCITMVGTEMYNSIEVMVEDQSNGMRAVLQHIIKPC